ncbi:MAG: M16 family metallopeptidase [Candidatus Dormibacteria bacterium]
MRERASVTVAYMFGAGSRLESEADQGLAHFIEHMVFKGGERFPSARDISAAIEGVGGVLNASTDREATIFWAKVPAAHTSVAIEVLGDMLFTPRLLESDVERERQVVVEELRMYEDSPQDHVQTLFDAVMWPDHPLGRDVAGTEASVRSFSAQHCRRHLAAHYGRGNLVVSVAGAIDPAEVCRLVCASLQRWPASSPAPASPQPATEPSGEPLTLLERRTGQANIVIGARAPSYRDDRRFAADVLNILLGEGMSSRLFQEVREERGLAYDVHSFLTRVSDSGALAMAMGCDPPRAAEATKAAVGELRRLATDLVPEEELARAVAYGRGRLAVQLEGTSALCNHLGQQELLTGEILSSSELDSRLAAVSREDVRDLAAAILGNGLRGAVIGPFRSPRRFLDLLVT